MASFVAYVVSHYDLYIICEYEFFQSILIHRKILEKNEFEAATPKK